MDWKEVLAPVKESEQFRRLWDAVKQEYAMHTCYPPKSEIFRAIQETPFDVVKIVLLGQDPYHNPGQANGLSFSVKEGIAAPPSLRNIFKELEADTGKKRVRTDLSDWAQQGVLLLNAGLSVRAHQANSHSELGWQFFTDYIIRQLSVQRSHLAFILWGSFAQKKAALIDPSRHLILSSAHPSPLSAHRGFFGSAPFSKANAYLEQHGIAPVIW